MGSENLGGGNLLKLLDVMQKIDFLEQWIQKLAKVERIGIILGKQHLLGVKDGEIIEKMEKLTR